MALALFLPCQVAAQTLNIDDIDDIAPVDFLPEDVFLEQTELLEETPFGDESLAFSVQLPKGWASSIKLPIEMSNKEEGASLLGLVSRYVSPAKDYLRDVFSVEAVELKHNVPIKYWFTNYVLIHGYSLEAVTIHSNNKIEAIYVEVEGDNTSVVRILALSNGARMVLVRYRIPFDKYEEKKQIQAQVLRSFSLKTRQNDGAEEIRTHGFLSESYFDYLETWKLIPSKVASVDRMRASLVQGTDRNNLDGQMGIFLTSTYEKTSLKNEVRLFKEKLDIPKYKLGRFIEVADIDYHKDMTFGVTEVYEMIPTVSTQVEYELWVSVMQNNDYYYIVSLLTPAREDNQYKWSRNVSAFKTVVQSMRRYDDSDRLFID
jgi:hypothetical protein